MARAQWQAKLNLNDQELAGFDQAIADMNDKLYQTMQVVADELQSTDKLSSEAGIRIMNEVTTTLVETYDQIGEVIPAEQRPQIEGMEMQDFIDPAAFDPLIDVRDKL
jgi:flavodoxin